MAYKLGSLFDGSGGFPLAGSLCGVEPRWAAEIEPYPIAVTRSRFPNMKHLGDISKVNGGEVEPVDIITFGSPCQDLSVAGKRAGLKHEANGDEETTRSGLFMEAVRIIKEMREATNGRCPTFALWENVPGAFSSNNGEDFRIVLQELIQIAEPTAVMPEVPKNGWAYADSYCGDGWSIAYRVLDAQHWGVPQRRRRIYLVADFRGERARKVLFEREGLRGYFETGRTPWQTATGDAESSIGTADCESECVGFDMYNQQCTGDVTRTLKTPVGGDDLPVIYYSLEPGIAAREGGHIYEGVSGTLRANAGDNQMSVAYGVDVYNQTLTGDKAKTLNSAASDADHVPCAVYSIENHPADSRVNIDESGKVQTLTSRMGTGGGNVPMVLESQLASGYDKLGATSQNSHDIANKTDTSYTLNTTDVHGVVYSLETFHCVSEEEKTTTLKARDYKDPICVTVHCFWDESQTASTLTANNANGAQRMPDKDNFNCVLVAGVDCRNMKELPDLYPTLQAKPNGGQSLNFSHAVRIHYIVRRLTPTECARLQGFPDAWGHPNVKDELTDEEYQFWLNVRNTHAAINGKPTKEYTKEQILKWYNSLHTDSSEYKMWGNGIALPNALYVMQGIADMMSEEKSARRKWLDDLLGDCL